MTSALQDDVANWTVHDVTVVQWLHLLDMDHLAQSFRKNGVNGSMLLLLDYSDITDDLSEAIYCPGVL